MWSCAAWSQLLHTSRDSDRSVWNHDGMVTGRGEPKRLGNKSYSSATLSTPNFTLSHLGLDLDVHGERLLFNHLSCGMVSWSYSVIGCSLRCWVLSWNVVALTVVSCHLSNSIFKWKYFCTVKLKQTSYIQVRCRYLLHQFPYPVIPSYWPVPWI
jgi:hypothetical protein